jgi:hypothetical protein
MRTRLGLLCAAIVVALALVSTDALARDGARIASSCQVQGVRPVAGRFTQRLVLHGEVSCAQARRTYLAFLHDADSGACGSGRICGVLQPGGWQCSFLSSVESNADGGLLAGCSREGASFGAYNLAGNGGKGGSAGCSNETVAILTGPKPTPVTLRFVVRGVSCHTAHTLIRTYFRHQATAGYCLKHGNICAWVSGGWTCSFPLYEGEGGGYFAACARENPSASVKVYTVTRHAVTAADPPSLSIADEPSRVPATSAAAGRSCGIERVQPGTIGPPTIGSSSGPGIPYKIIVWRGKVSCRKARSLIKATGEGKGTWHEAPDIAAIYTSFPGGWRCALATGGGYGCVRGRRIGASGYTDEVDGIQQL